MESVLDDNPEYSESRAYAICYAQQNEGNLAADEETFVRVATENNLTPSATQELLSMDAVMLEDPCWDGFTMVGTKTVNGREVPNCVPDDEVPDANLSGRRLAEFRNPERIERHDEGDTVRYTDVHLLTPGVWADAGSRTHVDYNAEAIRRSADNWVDLSKVAEAVPEWGTLGADERANVLADLGEEVQTDEAPLNFLHGPAMYGADSLDNIGHIPTDSIAVDDDGRLFGDIVLSRESPQGETAIDLMDEVLEAASNGEDPPPVGPSVEIPADRTTNDGDGKSLEEAWFSATGIVFNPASRPVDLGNQAQERAVAMTAAEPDTPDAGTLLLRRASLPDDGTPKWLPRHRRTMTDFDPDEMDDAELARALETMREDMDEIHRALQDYATVAGVVDMARAEGFDVEESNVAELRDFVAEMDDVSPDEVEEFDDAAAEFFGAEETDFEDSEDAPAEAMVEWVMNQSEPDQGDDDEPEEEEEGEVTMSDLNEIKSTVAELAEFTSDVKEMLTAREEDRAETMDELERRLSALEDEPDNEGRALTAASGDGGFVSTDDDGSDTAPKEHEDAYL